MWQKKLTRRCNQILDYLPTDYPERVKFTAKLSTLCHDAYYTAPEIQWRKWRQLEMLLIEALPASDSTDWTMKISQIVRGIQDPDPLQEWIPQGDPD